MTITVKMLKVQKLRNNEYYGIQSVLDNLYENSRNGAKFNKLLEAITSEENIKLAFRNIKANKGSKTPGIDGKTIKDIKYLETKEYIDIVRRKFSNYNPKRIKRVEIPKVNGKMRPLGIPTIIDRIIQQCILQILDPICEAKFANISYGFRPNRSTKNAIAHMYKYMQIQKLHYVVDVDLKGFFDNVSHEKLIKQMWTLGIQDKNLLKIISKMLKADVVLPNGEQQKSEKGTPQGGILSPLLSNIALNEFDWWIKSQWQDFKITNPTEADIKDKRAEGRGIDKGGMFRKLRRKSRLKEVHMVRYADDFKLFCKSYQEALKIKHAVVKWLKNRLGLEVNEDKTGITNVRKNYSEFLGIKVKVFIRGKKWVVSSHMSNKSYKRTIMELRSELLEIKNAKGKFNETRLIDRYNLKVLGLHEYFDIATRITDDMNEIKYKISKIYKTWPLQRRTKKYGNGFRYKAFQEIYGKSKQVRYVSGNAIVPVGYVRHGKPMMKRTLINKYTEEGRKLIHKNIRKSFKKNILEITSYYFGKRSILTTDNIISLYLTQHGKCSVTKEELTLNNLRCHHKIPQHMQGTDEYINLILVTEDVHILIHATELETINKYLTKIILNKSGKGKLNELRKLVGNEIIQF